MAARFAAMATVVALAGPAGAAEPPLAAVTLIGEGRTVFDPKRNACDGDDVPDANARAFRAADGSVSVFAMHMKNRALRGPDLDSLKIDCVSPLPSRFDPDPSRHDDARWITATWTEDGRRIDALVHHEYRANTHPGRCTSKEYLACWYNTVIAASSTDAGRTFQTATPPAVVAGAPFRQEVGQGRHRGFFNPSNIFGDGRARFVMISTTGWSGQPSGPCLFRSSDGTEWRAHDGRAFAVRFGDPYRDVSRSAACRPIAPFPAPVGAVVRHRPSGAWIAVFQARADGDQFKVPGFYTTASRDLLHWDEPRLLLEGPTLYDDLCGASGKTMINYPSLLDREAEGRNFDNVGENAELWFTTLRIEKCGVVSRELVRRRVAVRVL